MQNIHQVFVPSGDDNLDNLRMSDPATYALVLPVVTEVRRQRDAGERAKPSAKLIDRSVSLTPEKRIILLDKVASLVDRNWIGRSEMCIQFAALLQRALTHLGLPARAVLGTATYFDNKGKQIFSWSHGWVRIAKEVIDGNVDSISENPALPKTIDSAPYWGPVSETPKDRHLREHHEDKLLFDPDVEGWWVELRLWLDTEFKSI